MKSILLSAVAVLGLSVAVGCTTTTSDGSGGGSEGGGNEGGGSTTNVTTGTTTGTTTGGLQTCEELAPSCDGDGSTPSSGCAECAILGDTTVATDGGACQASYVACYGTDGEGTGATSAECVALLGCLDACEVAHPDTDSVEFLDCLCTNDGAACSQTQSDPDTCLGADTGNTGLIALFAFEDCLTEEVCPVACGQ